jgi:hypothetical protein
MNAVAVENFKIETLVDHEPDVSYLEGDRLKSYESGEFHYIGIIATCDLKIDLGNDYHSIQHLTSSGLWGIESDSNPKYLEEIGEDEKKELRDILDSLQIKYSEGESKGKQVTDNDLIDLAKNEYSNDETQYLKGNYEIRRGLTENQADELFTKPWYWAYCSIPEDDKGHLSVIFLKRYD